MLRAANLAVVKLPPKTVEVYYLSPEWKALRLACLRRDHFRCVACGGGAVVADHIVSRHAGGRDELGNLRALCRVCDNRLRERPGRDRTLGQGGGV
jgi:5-methylcytosine-specific restriction endonuclease McrA